jgi:hypothetical protein
LKNQDKIEQYHVEQDAIKTQEILVKADNGSAKIACPTEGGTREHLFISILLLGPCLDV